MKENLVAGPDRKSASMANCVYQYLYNIVAGAIVVLAVGSLLIGCASPALRAMATQEGLASYYGKEFDGRKTSSGEIFHKDDLTAAHRTYPFGTILRVTNLKNGGQVNVRVNDRGPVKPERIIDLSYGAAKAIGLDRMGLARVRLEVIDWGK
ncbi:MAG: septal ring lytic transglycosylase RlpA family protein [Bacteroidota bacterium]|nr:septal ring lytic transglycosylase RlpA family protein [Bacteroidota bacterium]MDP4230778.1 septal ring lytic transglycosylase RlpA family protein [Bacteroidota bacterium]